LPVRFKQQLLKLQTVGVAPPPDNPPHYRAAVEAGLFGDRVASHEWLHNSRLSSGVRDPPPCRSAPQGIRSRPTNPSA
jgi:hypothetical protein